MSGAENASRLTVFTTESAVAPDGRPLHLALVERARQDGLAGATVLRGVEGFGASGHLLTTRFADLAAGLPLVIEIVDRDERIDSFLPALRQIAGDELVLRQAVSIDAPA
ncbi:MAG TPA: DUF190 domain-containing protein [Acidimicrobiales bacterium]|jgi:uncharacterized protein|nr:DUF190 domain-containing protein [Acidimicrobiales bacterium]